MGVSDEALKFIQNTWPAWKNPDLIHALTGGRNGQMTLAQFEQFLNRIRTRWHHGEFDYKPSEIIEGLGAIGFQRVGGKRDTFLELSEMYLFKSTEELEELIERGKTEEGKRWKTPEEFMDRPPVSWLIDETLQKEAIMFLYGQPGSGKSFVALDWACCVQAGIPWQVKPGLEVNQGKVVFVVMQGATGFSKRLRAWTLAHPQADISGMVFYDTPVVSLHNKFKEVGKFLDEMNSFDEAPALIVWDTVFDMMAGGSLIEDGDAMQLMSVMSLITRKTGAASLLVHHSVKSGETMFGSQVLIQAADIIVEASQKDKLFNLAFKKSKELDEPKKVTMRLFPVEVPGEEKLSAVPGRVLPDAQQKIYRKMDKDLQYTPQQLCPAKSGDPRNTRRLLNTMEEKGLVKKVSEEAGNQPSLWKVDLSGKFRHKYL